MSDESLTDDGSVIAIAWQWQPGSVDRSKEHLELYYRCADDGEWPLVALVGPPVERTFPVQFLLDRWDECGIQTLRDLFGELDYYLVNLGEEDPWAYATYHCGTAANMYAPVRWRFFGVEES